MALQDYRDRVTQGATDQFLTTGRDSGAGLLHRGQGPILWGGTGSSALAGRPTGLEHLGWCGQETTQQESSVTTQTPQATTKPLTDSLQHID